MSANIAQVYNANPSTFLNNNDLIYIGQAGTTDSAIQYGDLANQIGAGLWSPGSGGSGAIQDGFAGNAGGAGAFAFGGGANNTGSIALGNVQSNGMYSLAVGFGCETGSSGNQANYSFAYGNQSMTAPLGPSDYSFAFGNSCFTGQFGTGNYSFAFGNNCSTGFNGNADYAFAYGNTCHVTGAYSFAIGNAATTLNNGSVVWGDSNSTPNGDTAANQFNLTFANGYRLFGGSLNVETAGSGLAVAEGSDCKQGIATLSLGTVVVSNASVTASSRILLTAQDNNSVGALRVSARTAGTSFTITSSSAIDSGVVAYEIFEPAA